MTLPSGSRTSPGIDPIADRYALDLAARDHALGHPAGFGFGEGGAAKDPASANHMSTMRPMTEPMP